MAKKHRQQNLPEIKKHFMDSPWMYIIPVAWASVALYYYLKIYPVSFASVSALVSRSWQGAGITDILYTVHYLPHILLVTLFVTAALGIGIALSKLFKLDFDDPYVGAVMKIGLGFTAIIYYQLFTGLMGLLYPVTAAIPLLAGLAFALRSILRHGSPDDTPPVQRKESVSLLVKVCGAITVVFLFFVLLGALTPETFYDSLNYHTGVPLYWVQHHAITPISHSVYSYFSNNIHVFYGTGLLFGNEITTKLMHVAFGLLIMFALYHWSRRHFSREMGIVAMFIFISVPFVPMVMWKTAIELGLGFFETLALLCALYYVSGEKQNNRQFLVLSAVFCGAAVGGKYFSVYSLAGIMAMLAAGLLLKKEKITGILLTLFAMSAITLALLVPYLARNYAWTGNMTYPFGISVEKDINSVVKGKVEEVNDPAVPDRSLTNFLTLPWNLTMGKQTQEPMSGAMLLLFLPLPLLFWKTDLRIRLLALYCLVYYFCWFYVRTYFRYMLPLMPALAILYAYYITVYFNRKIIKTVLLGLGIAASASSLNMVVVNEMVSMDPFRVVLGVESREKYLFTSRPTYPNPYYGVIAWANEHLPANAKIMFIGESRGYYSRRKFMTFSTSDFCPLIQLLDGCKDADEYRQKLADEGITHVLVNMPEAIRLAGYDLLHFTPGQYKMFLQFWNKYANEIHRDIADLSIPQQAIRSMREQQPAWWQNYSSNPGNYVYLYEILSPAAAQQPRHPPINLFLLPQLYPQPRWNTLSPITTNTSK